MGERYAKWSVVQVGKYGSGGRESLETRCVESLLVVHVCASLLSLIDAKREFLHNIAVITTLQKLPFELVCLGNDHKFPFSVCYNPKVN